MSLVELSHEEMYEEVLRRDTETGDERWGEAINLGAGSRPPKKSQILGAALSGGANGRAWLHDDRHVDYPPSPQQSSSIAARVAMPGLSCPCARSRFQSRIFAARCRA